MRARGSLRSAGVLALVLLLPGGCGAPDLYVDALVAPEPGACDSRVALELREVQTITLDTALSEEYLALLRIGNTSGSSWTPGSARVSLRTPDGAPLVEDFKVPATGTVSGRYGLIEVPLVPAGHGASFAAAMRQAGPGSRATVLVTVGFGPDSDILEATWSLELCNGCLIAFPLAALDVAGQCSAKAKAAPPPPCRIGQDDPVDCRLCSAENPACKSP